MKQWQEEHHEYLTEDSDGEATYRCTDSREAIIPPDLELRCYLMELHHNHPTAGHPGQDETIIKMRQHYYWPGMAKWIEEYIQGCAMCQESKIRTHQAKTSLYKIPVPAIRWDRTLGLEMGQCTDHVPLPTLSQEAVPQALFLHSSRITVRPYSFRPRLPFLLSFFRASATPHHPPPSYATRLPSYFIRHHVALTTAAAPSAHATKRAQPPLRSPTFRCTLSYPTSFLHCYHLCLATSPPCRAVSATNTHLTIVASQCGLRTPSPLKIVVFNQFCR
jgi:hypothetical protein